MLTRRFGAALGAGVIAGGDAMGEFANGPGDSAPFRMDDTTDDVETVLIGDIGRDWVVGTDIDPVAEYPVLGLEGGCLELDELAYPDPEGVRLGLDVGGLSGAPLA
jgi:hypothetical protein